MMRQRQIISTRFIEAAMRQIDKKYKSQERYHHGFSRNYQINISRMLMKIPQQKLQAKQKQLTCNNQIILITTKASFCSPEQRKKCPASLGEINHESIQQPEIPSPISLRNRKRNNLSNVNCIRLIQTGMTRDKPFKTTEINDNKKLKSQILPKLEQKPIFKQKKFIIKQPPNKQTAKDLPLLMHSPQQLKSVKSQSYIIIQHPSNRVVVSYRSNLSLQIASLTKIMTYFVTVKIAKQNNIDIKAQTTIISQEAAQIGGTSAELIAGQIYTIQQLLYGLMLPSGNDAALTLAQWGGKFFVENQQFATKVKTFVRQMNKIAKQIGLKNTTFGNPHGLPSIESKSTAQQVAKLSSICMNDLFFCELVKTKLYTFWVSNTQNENSRQIIWQNTNKLLRRQNFLGIKTGITVTAGPCLSTAYQFRDKVYITVVLRAPKVSRRFKQTRKILNWALEKLFKDSLSQQQKKILTSLRKNKPDIDSDNSEDEQQFKYDLSASNKAQYKRRCNILTYQM